MLAYIDTFLNKTTMYKVVLYYLLAIVGCAVALAAVGQLPFHSYSILFSVVFIGVVCWLANSFFARMYKVSTNSESYSITALILTLIISPPIKLIDTGYFELALWASIVAMGSKYVLARNRKHFFNPAAIACVIAALVLGDYASWWVGSSALFPVVLIGGLVLVRKLLHGDVVLSFFAVALVSTLGASALGSSPVLSSVSYFVFSSPVLFLAFVMLTEPSTMPSTRTLRVIYGALTGLMFASGIHIGSFYLTPELALVFANVFSYAMSPKQKLLLTLKEKVEVATEVFNFYFTPDKKISFVPGQYMEWTLNLDKADNRGNRRYFTIASSPTEETVLLAVKFYPGPSTLKQKLKMLEVGDTLIAGSLSGDFTLPKDKNIKLAFIAGGIGVTPFRSMIKMLSDTNEKRNIVMFYSNSTADEIIYKEIWSEAQKRIGLKMVYVLTDASSAPAGFSGHVGRIDSVLLLQELPDYKERHFYISGPRSMIVAYKKILTEKGVPTSHIKEDFFPGYA